MSGIWRLDDDRRRWINLEAAKKTKKIEDTNKWSFNSFRDPIKEIISVNVDEIKIHYPTYFEWDLIN